MMLNLAAIRQMITWCFAYDKVNYARFLTYVLLCHDVSTANRTP